MKFAMFCVLENTEYVHSIYPLNEAKKNLQNVKEKVSRKKSVKRKAI